MTERTAAPTVAPLAETGARPPAVSTGAATEGPAAGGVGLALIEATIERLVAVLDRESLAARAGQSLALQACYQEKFELCATLEAAERALAAAAPAGAPGSVPPLLPAQRAGLEARQRALEAALGRNEAALRAAGDAIARLIQGATQALRPEPGYGPRRALLHEDARLFALSTV